MPSAISRPKILIASTLKSVRDTRGWEKFGLSLRETNKYEINIIGFSAKKEEISDEICFYSSGVDFSNPASRLKAQWNFLQVLRKVRPQLLICCTFEYLLLARSLKAKYGYALIYDVQENYQLNLSLRKDQSLWKKNLWKSLIRFSENTQAIDHYIFAEQCYKKQMSDRRPTLVLENKFVGEIKTILPKKVAPKQGYQFILSGTIAQSFGLVEAVTFFKKIREAYPFSQLKIIGHITQNDMRNACQNWAKNDPGISLEIEQNPLPHSRILDAMKQADFVLCPYQNEPAFEGKIPSKFFEAQALGIPVLYSRHPVWDTFYKTSKAGFALDFNQEEAFLTSFQSALEQVYFLEADSLAVNWESDKAAFLNLVSSLL